MSKSLKVRRLQRQVVEFMKSYDGGCSDSEIMEFEKWISSRDYTKDLERYQEELKCEEKLDCIVKELRETLPKDAVLPDENIVPPEDGEEDAKEALHIDAFLYDDDQVETFFPKSSKYCKDCLSDNIEDREIISHSLSRLKLKYLFNIILPADIEDKKILDVGSRIGAVLYGAYYYSNCKNIFGVEMNKDFYEIQKDMILKHSMESRIKVINDNVLNLSNLCIYDIVILNNVFQYFLSPKKEIEIWTFLRKSLKKGCILVTVPSIEETFVNLGVHEKFSNWLQKVPNHQSKNNYYSDEEELEFHDMYLYEIK